ncbi:unnamed protein product [Amoebophrya sp. A25]|nr:unnamed protein product [Amoebophrya sp. A25]|eukprot:GSA25T00027139001.1
MTLGGSFPRWARTSVSAARSLTRHGARMPAQPADGEVMQYGGQAGLIDRRQTQAEGVQWFLQLAKDLAPEFEFYELPRFSSCALLIRRRTAYARTPFEGLWSPLQVRASICRERDSSVVDMQDSMPLDAFPGKRRRAVYYVSNRSSYRTFPDAPCVVMSPLSYSCFVFSRSGRTSKLRAKPGDANEIDLRRSLDALGMWLRSVYAFKTPPACLTGSFDEFFINSTMSAALRKHRTFLLQLLQLPLLQNVHCRRQSDCTATAAAWNATYCDRRLFVRGPIKRADSRVQDGLRRLYYSMTRRGGHALPRNACGIDYFVVMLDTIESPTALGGIGVIPLAATRPGFLLKESPAGEPAMLKQQVIMVLDENNIIVGGDCKAHASEFFFFFSQKLVSNRNVLEVELASFFTRIFTKWDNCTVSKDHENKDGQ